MLCPPPGMFLFSFTLILWVSAQRALLWEILPNSPLQAGTGGSSGEFFDSRPSLSPDHDPGMPGPGPLHHLQCPQTKMDFDNFNKSRGLLRPLSFHG